MTDGDAHDPKGLVAEAYRMEGIGPGECRSIFLDWALGVAEPGISIPVLLERYGERAHPMTAVLRDGLAAAPRPRRRGGSRGRRI
jgi:hypothetical protein